MTLTKKKELKKPTKVKSLPKKELSLSKEQQKKLGDIFDKLPKSKQMKMFPELPLKMQTKMFPTLPPEIQTIILSPWLIIEKSFNAFLVEEMIFFLDKLMVFAINILQRKN